MTDQTTEPVTQKQETVTKQKNPLRIEQGKKLAEYNKRKKGGTKTFEWTDYKTRRYGRSQT